MPFYDRTFSEINLQLKLIKRLDRSEERAKKIEANATTHSKYNPILEPTTQTLVLTVFISTD
jgi:hypothetical protein